MKKNPFSQSGLFNLRILFAFALCSIGALLAVLSFATTRVTDAFGGTDINLITGPETSPHITQNKSATWGHGNTVVVAYQDSSGITLSPLSYCGVSTSTDGGNTFTRLPEKFNTGGACSGDPSVFYSVRAAKWFASFLASRCGGQGVGHWTSLDGINWINGSCPFSGSNADLVSSWVDNNPASPFYGSQYAAFNNFSVGGGAVQVARSTDDGLTWSAPSTLFASFRRAWKVTGSLGVDGTVFVQTLEEGGGGFNPRQNFIHRSTDGGVTWSAPISQGATFPAPGRSISAINAYFVGMYSTPVAGYWTEMGWGEPAVGPNGVVHYAYCAGAAGDPGNIYYIRSTDSGFTWSTPLLFNTDATTRAQWSPSLSVNTQGNVFVSWYDERNTATDALERFGRASLDNGAIWGTEMAHSDVIFPKPLQPDASVQSTDVGIFNRTAFSNDGNGGTAYHAWTDGRVPINGQPQQDVFFDRIHFTPTIIISNGGSAIVSAGPNGVLDPGETVTVSLGAQNTGGPGVLCTTPALTGTLQATGGVTNPTPSAQNYGVLCSGDPPVFRNFTFKVSPSLPCGSPVTASLVMTDGVTNYGTLTFNFPTGTVPPPTPIQYFDGVTAPTLPPSWTTTFSGSGTAVTTSTTNPDTAPNTLFATESATVGLSEVTSALIALPASLPRLTFRNLFNTEPGYDGEVLEISINGGAFADILAAGGSFVSGGYNATLNTGFSNPLPGRQAWSGLSGGTAGAPTYITSVINLPPAAAGQNIRLKWRVGSDESVVPATNPGVRIDTVAFQVPFVCAPVPTVAVSRKSHGGTWNIALPLAGPVGIECRAGQGAMGKQHKVLVTFANPVTVGGASVTSGIGSVSSFSVNGSQVTVNLAGVANAQRITITLTNVDDGTNIGDVAVPMGLLLGDTTGSGSVNSSDIGQTKSKSGQAAAASNFRSDATVSGSINASDIGLVKSKSGTQLP